MVDFSYCDFYHGFSRTIFRNGVQSIKHLILSVSTPKIFVSLNMSNPFFQEYLKFCAFTSSLLKKSEKLSELIGMLESEVGEMELDKNRVAKTFSSTTLGMQSEPILLHR